MQKKSEFCRFPTKKSDFFQKIREKGKKSEFFQKIQSFVNCGHPVTYTTQSVIFNREVLRHNNICVFVLLQESDI